MGFEQAKIFGYEISQGKYSLGKDCKQAIMNKKFPTSVKTMQHSLDLLFFRNFVPNYSDLTAKLHKMTSKILIGTQKLGLSIIKLSFLS
jgi:hypothetical protein